MSIGFPGVFLGDGSGGRLDEGVGGYGAGWSCCGLCSGTLFCAVGLKNGGFLTVSFFHSQSGRLELLADDLGRLFVRQSLPGRLAVEKRNSKESHHFFVTPLQNQVPGTEAAAGPARPIAPTPSSSRPPLPSPQEDTRETNTHLKDSLHYVVHKVKKTKDKKQKIKTKKKKEK